MEVTMIMTMKVPKSDVRYTTAQADRGNGGKLPRSKYI
jgi:hypothetical protein